MSLRCRPGDLALVIRGKSSGTMLTCVKYIGTSHEFNGDDLWEIDRAVRWTTDSGEVGFFKLVPDSFLIPIRPRPDTENLTDQEKDLTRV